MVAVDLQPERRATWLELFFDLVFVVAVAELAGVLRADPDWGGVARFAALSVPVVWAWMNFIFYADQFDTDDVPYRFAVFGGMLASAALAISLPEAGAGFVVAYVAIKAIMVGLYERARRHADTRLARRFCAWCVVAYGASAIVWLVSLAFDAPVRQVLWALGLAIEIGTPAFGPKEFAEMPFDVAALAATRGGFHTGAALVAAACFALACALWWLYFDRIEDNVLGGAIRPNLVFIYGHPPLFAALTAVAVGARFAIEHAGGAALALAPRAILAGGTAATLVALCVVQVATLRPPPRRALAARAVAGAVALGAIALPLPALALAAGLALVLGATAAAG